MPLTIAEAIATLNSRKEASGADDGESMGTEHWSLIYSGLDIDYLELSDCSNQLAAFAAEIAAGHGVMGVAKALASDMFVTGVLYERSRRGGQSPTM